MLLLLRLHHSIITAAPIKQHICYSLNGMIARVVHLLELSTLSVLYLVSSSLSSLISKLCMYLITLKGRGPFLYAERELLLLSFSSLLMYSIILLLILQHCYILISSVCSASQKNWSQIRAEQPRQFLEPFDHIFISQTDENMFLINDSLL